MRRQTLLIDHISLSCPFHIYRINYPCLLHLTDIIPFPTTPRSRFQKGVVKVHDSYKFPSTLWELTAFHFKSIDTWLEGKHESFCCDHPWHSEALALMAAAGKRSIFNETLTEEDENAGGMEMDEEIPPASRPPSSAAGAEGGIEEAGAVVCEV